MERVNLLSLSEQDLNDIAQAISTALGRQFQSFSGIVHMSIGGQGISSQVPGVTTAAHYMVPEGVFAVSLAGATAEPASATASMQPSLERESKASARARRRLQRAVMPKAQPEPNEVEFAQFHRRERLTHEG